MSAVGHAFAVFVVNERGPTKVEQGKQAKGMEAEIEFTTKRLTETVPSKRFGYTISAYPLTSPLTLWIQLSEDKSLNTYNQSFSSQLVALVVLVRGVQRLVSVHKVKREHLNDSSTDHLRDGL